MEKVGCRLGRDLTILPSMCTWDAKLSIPSALDTFQNTATLHSSRCGIGPMDMDRNGMFWILTKIRIHINRMPEMMEQVETDTWIQAAERVSCERDFSITSGDEVLAYGKSMWAVLSRDEQKLVRMESFYPVMDFNIPSPDDRSFVRLSKKLDDAEEIGKYTVRSVDIDLGGHMNNVNYVRAMLGCFTSEELEAMNISEIEMNYILQTYEGESLTFMRKMTDKGMEVGAVNKDGKIAYIALIS